MSEIVMKMDLCNVCKRNKAEYLWYRMGIFGNVTIKFLCPKCYELIDDLK
jgi:hypothetical protein